MTKGLNGWFYIEAFREVHFYIGGKARCGTDKMNSDHKAYADGGHKHTKCRSCDSRPKKDNSEWNEIAATLQQPRKKRT